MAIANKCTQVTGAREHGGTINASSAVIDQRIFTLSGAACVVRRNASSRLCKKPRLWRTLVQHPIGNRARRPVAG